MKVQHVVIENRHETHRLSTMHPISLKKMIMKGKVTAGQNIKMVMTQSI